MRTRRVQKVKALHVTQVNPTEGFFWKPLTYEFKGMETFQDREEEIIDQSWYDYDRGEEKEWEKLADESFDPCEWERELQAREEAQALAHGIDVHSNVDCNCCCHEHTSPYCEARLQYSCKSGLRYGEDESSEAEMEAWKRTRGLVGEEF